MVQVLKSFCMENNESLFTWLAMASQNMEQKNQQPFFTGPSKYSTYSVIKVKSPHING